MTTIAQSIVNQFVDPYMVRKAALCLAVTQTSLDQAQLVYTFTDGSELQTSDMALVPVAWLLDTPSGEVDTAEHWQQRQANGPAEQPLPARQLVPASMNGYGKWVPEVYRRFVCFDPLHGLRDVTLADIPVGAGLRIDQAFYDAASRLDLHDIGGAWGVWGLVDRQLLERAFRNGYPVHEWAEAANTVLPR
ncbi:hypothetical protein [Silvimonas soli]|uniref:hypothetical protein n=1 Tax=Silvimonas soli TaxID=2980100 RepID=UPI0024B3555B|nr:hypothetical protein [Silvimonas soli]